jgi:Zn-dependent protease with chaperone function
MIPSSPRRTWLALLLSCLFYFGPDLLVPSAWSQTSTYTLLYGAYLGSLVVLGFWFGPMICHALAVSTIRTGPLYDAIERAKTSMKDTRPVKPPVTLFDHMMPFVLTAGLLPKRSEVFISSGLTSQLTSHGLEFVLARATAHATLRHRLVAFLPILIFTVFLPDDMKSISTWLIGSGFLALWLMLHWIFELDADRCAARVVGDSAADALREWLTVTNPHSTWLTTHPPLTWRLRAVQIQG